MIIYPAIDLMDGKVVRLRRGNYAEQTVFSEDPLAVAERMLSEGATWLHIVDLDGAREGRPLNLKVVNAIFERFHPNIQFGGGLRSVLQIEDALEAGAARAILSTRVLTDPDFLHLICDSYEGVIAISIDAEANRVRVSGWQEETPLTVSEALTMVEEAGGQLVIFTDIASDGTNAGLDAAWVRSVLSLTNLPVIYAGGVSSLFDLETLTTLETEGLEGAIIGRAYYEGLVDLSLAIERFQKPQEEHE